MPSVATPTNEPLPSTARVKTLLLNHVMCVCYKVNSFGMKCL